MTQFDTLLATLNVTPSANLTSDDKIPFLNTGDGKAYTSTVSQLGALVGLGSASINITTAQIEALHTTPIELVPAPGANKLIAPVYMVTSVYNFTTPWSGGGGDFCLTYGSNATTNALASSLYWTLSGTPVPNASNVKFLLGQFVAIQSYDVTPAQMINGGLYVTATSAMTGGNGTLRITLLYTVVDIPASA